jgi:hypothetical protein
MKAIELLQLSTFAMSFNQALHRNDNNKNGLNNGITHKRNLWEIGKMI